MNEVPLFTATSSLALLKNSCSKLHCQNVYFSFIFIQNSSTLPALIFVLRDLDFVVLFIVDVDVHCVQAPHTNQIKTDTAYRGTSLMRKRLPPRIPLRAKACSYGRVLGEGVVL